MRPPFDVFYRLLILAQDDRDLMPLDFDEGTPQPYWNDHEKIVMWREVNRMRKAASLPLAPYKDIEHAEQQASGHIDYTKKFALYCAELAVRNDSDTI